MRKKPFFLWIEKNMHNYYKKCTGKTEHFSMWRLAKDCFITIICAHCADLIRRCLNTSGRFLARRPIQYCCLQSHLLQYTDLILPVYWQSSQLLSMSHFSWRPRFERIIVMKKVFQFVSKRISQRLSSTSGVALINSPVFYDQNSVLVPETKLTNFQKNPQRKKRTA